MGFNERRLALIKDGEGNISHMYLDTRGLVTVGVGQMIPTADEATRLSFVKRDTSERATADEIREGYDAVKAQPKGKVAHSYQRFSKLDMPQADIDVLLARRLDEFEQGLRREIPTYDDAPEDAKLGLIDMAYNLGIGGLVNKFPSFTGAARAADWAGCARECHRRGISDARNEEVKHLFESAAGGDG